MTHNDPELEQALMRATNQHAFKETPFGEQCTVCRVATWISEDGTRKWATPNLSYLSTAFETECQRGKT